jgi:hypothetical protein
VSTAADHLDFAAPCVVCGAVAAANPDRPAWLCPACADHWTCGLCHWRQAGTVEKAYHSHDPLAIIAAGKTWGVPNVAGPFTGRFVIPAQKAKQALQLQRTLIPSA